MPNLGQWQVSISSQLLEALERRAHPEKLNQGWGGVDWESGQQIVDVVEEDNCVVGTGIVSHLCLEESEENPHRTQDSTSRSRSG